MYIKKTLASFLIILLLMPLGHALMILMEHYMEPTALHYAAFLMGLLGFLIAIGGVYVRGDTRQTVCGLVGAMLFWTGWVEFLFVYYAQRYGVHCDLRGTGLVETATQYIDGMAVSHQFLINGQPLDTFTRPELKALRGSRPEYLIMPATFGLWMMVMAAYVFRTRTGCDFLLWVQRHLPVGKGNHPLPSMGRAGGGASLTVFMEWNAMMWGLYLLLMFCYDPVFLGERHPVTLLVAAVCLVGSAMMLKRQLRIAAWGRNLRYALATVIVFWTFVEVMGRNGLLSEVWVDPLGHVSEMLLLVLTLAVAIIAARAIDR